MKCNIARAKIQVLPVLSSSPSNLKVEFLLLEDLYNYLQSAKLNDLSPNVLTAFSLGVYPHTPPKVWELSPSSPPPSIQYTHWGSV